jgi:hypothetical protein
MEEKASRSAIVAQPVSADASVLRMSDSVMTQVLAPILSILLSIYVPGRSIEALWWLKPQARFTVQETARCATFYMFENGDWPQLNRKMRIWYLVTTDLFADRYSVFQAFDYQTDFASSG